MVRTSAPTAHSNKVLSSDHGDKPIKKIQTNLKDAQVAPSSPNIPELGVTLETHDLNGELVKTNLAAVEGANDNIEALYQANKQAGIIK
ncbi:hypothetical protein KAR91_62880 [Candidatus Pacearchaeota archaeon]|nr:hypothetical protein [Candidatus Pacearchaeota archaeon]